MKFPERIRSLVPSFRRFGFGTPHLAVRRMARRWGSLSPTGQITLNSELIKAPTPCIDYVVAHELCHMVHDDHSAAFYNLLERVMPDWKARKDRLERVLV